MNQEFSFISTLGKKYAAEGCFMQCTSHKLRHSSVLYIYAPRYSTSHNETLQVVVVMLGVAGGPRVSDAGQQ